jgi:hypothetical protein
MPTKRMSSDDIEAYCDAECVQWVRDGAAHPIVTRLCQVEGVAELTRDVLQSLGSCTPSGVALAECTTGAEKAAARKEIVMAVCALKPNGLCNVLVPAAVTGAGERLRLMEAGVGRMVKRLVDAATELSAPSTPESGSQRIVVAKNEEDSQYTVQEYSTTECKDQLMLVQSYYNLRLQSWQYPTLSGLKKIMYAVKIECQFADPTRVTLEMMRRLPTDTHLMLLTRLCYGHVICAAGMAAPPCLRDEGAGKLSGDHRKTVLAQWGQGEHVQDLLSEVAEVESKLADADLKRVCKLIQMSLHKCTTSRGGQTLSLAARSQCGTVAEMCIRAEADDKTRGGRSARNGGGREKPPKKKGGGGKGGRDVRRRLDTTPEKPTTESVTRVTEWPDEDGAKGPNGLPRKKGGNTEGGACKRLRTEGECPFEFCSFSHKKKKET